MHTHTIMGLGAICAIILFILYMKYLAIRDDIKHAKEEEERIEKTHFDA